MPSFQRHVFVCINERPADDPRGSCKAKGGVEVRDRLKKELKARGIAKIVRANNAGCLDQCARGVSVVVYPEQVWYGGVTVDDVPEIVESHLVNGKVVDRLLMPDQPHLDNKVHLPVLKIGAVLLALLAFARPASAGNDPLAEDKAKEANLESNAPREGVTFSATIGPGLLIQGGTIGTAGMVDLRLGHVATPATVVTFELANAAFPHVIGTAPPTTYYDTSSSLMVGAQRYNGPSLWLRAAGGLNVHVIDSGPMGKSSHLGPAGAVGAGVDLVRRHFWVLDAEISGISAIEKGGLLVTGAISVGISHY